MQIYPHINELSNWILTKLGFLYLLLKIFQSLLCSKLKLSKHKNQLSSSRFILYQPSYSFFWQIFSWINISKTFVFQNYFKNELTSKTTPALIVLSLALIAALPAHVPVNISPKKLVSKARNRIPRNVSLCSFFSFAIVLVTPLI